MRVNKNYILAVAVPFLLAIGYFGLTKKNIFTFSLTEIITRGENDLVGLSSRNLEFIDTPKIVRGVYLTSWSAGVERKVDEVIRASKNYGINSVVIDIKDFSGHLAYDTNLEEVKKYKATEIRIPDVEGLIKKFHNAHIYVIARITVFQDPIVAKTRPEWAVTRKSNGSLWLDDKGLAWIDPANKDYWNYIIDISRDAHNRGFDELNFDYIRFPADGNLSDMKFPFWDGKVPKREIIRDFFKYLRNNLTDVKISVDLFGFSTVEKGDLDVGQVIEDAYENFDYISPMVYPSHYAKGFLGYNNPANYPYEVIKYSLDSAVKRFNDLNSEINSNIASSSLDLPEAKKKLGELRPWIQDFDLGANYNAQMVKLEIKAVSDALGEKFFGFLIWSPSNIYSYRALQ